MMRLLSFIFASVILASVSGMAFPERSDALRGNKESPPEAPTSTDKEVRAQNHSIIEELQDDVNGAVDTARVGDQSDCDYHFQRRWEFATFGSVPYGAVGSRGRDGRMYYVARAPHSNDLIPGTLDVSLNGAYISYGHSAFVKRVYEVLVSQCVRWVYMGNGNLPEDAIIGGSLNDNSFMYVGRTNMDDRVVFGKVVPSERTMYYPYNGQELTTNNYEVLAMDRYCNYNV